MKSRFEEFPELPDSAVRLWHDDVTRYPSELGTTCYGQPMSPELMAYATNLRIHQETERMIQEERRRVASRPSMLTHGNIPRWAPALSQHPAPWVSWDGRGVIE